MPASVASLKAPARGARARRTVLEDRPRPVLVPPDFANFRCQANKTSGVWARSNGAGWRRGGLSDPNGPHGATGLKPGASAAGASGSLGARPTAPRQASVLRGRALGAAPALTGGARRPPLHTRGRRSAVGALRHPRGHLSVDEADLGPLRYLQEPVLVHEAVAGHGQLFRLFA